MSDVLVAFVLGFALCLGIELVTDRYRRRKASKLEPDAKQELDEDFDWGQQARVTLPPEWVPLPGNRIELGASGFWIALDLAKDRPCRLFTPEGREVASSQEDYLAELKHYGEKLAANRAAFTLKSKPWTHTKQQ